MANDWDNQPPRKPRPILFVITDLDVGGAEKCCVQLATGLDRTRWSPTVCCLSPPGTLADRLREHGIPVVSLEAWHIGHLPRAAMRLTRLMVRLRPAVVHTFLFHANIVGRLIARVASTARVLCSVRVAEKRYRYHLILENLTCRWSHRIACVSHAVAHFTRRRAHVPQSRLVVVPNGIAPAPGDFRQLERTDLGVPPDSIVALYVGRLDEQKGVDVLLHALVTAQRQVSRLHLWVAGAGPDRDALVAQARELGLAPRVHFLGWRNDVHALMHAADFLVLPSRWEGMPNVVLEAMAAGLAVVATRVEGTAELVQDGATGRLARADDADELAAAMIEVSSDAALRSRWGCQGRAVAYGEFSLSRMIARYEQIYEWLLSDRS